MPFYEGQTIKVKQPFGDFYVISIPAKLLVQVCYSFAARYGDDVLSGVQRGINENRVKAIAQFCATSDAMFPTSVILSINLDENGESPLHPWYINDDSKLVIPTSDEIASIVDGQHRIEGLKKAFEKNELDADFDIVCAIYFELPAPKQAEVFATINFNQQKVDKSLAYQLFGYDLDSVESKYWSPDTLAIYLTRLLDKEDDSPFKGHVDFGMKKMDLAIPDEGGNDSFDKWYVSTSTMVQGISSLITNNPSKDRYYLHKKRIIRRSREILSDIDLKVTAPLRSYYIENKDGQIYDLVKDYFTCCGEIFWRRSDISFMRKTIGIQALFDLLKYILNHLNNHKQEISSEQVKLYLEKTDPDKLIGFNINYSGVGRTQIRDFLKSECGIN
ncbi:DGQHR domain-containing protein [Yersinia enterocolitica]|nr:DGQHR domain-containing protein [Yersinia enterocolitica]